LEWGIWYLDQTNTIYSYLNAGKIVSYDLTGTKVGIKGGTGLDSSTFHLDF